MKNVTYIDASAGSGKTYSLTQKLAEAIDEGRVRPDQVILTTFTVKAANEFRDRAKQFLYEKGRFEEAGMIDHALIGTIHSVANSLIRKYWFHLGLAPDMGVMAEEDTDFYISQSLSSLPTNEELKQLHDFIAEFGLERSFDNAAKIQTTDWDKWKGDLREIIGLATNYEITDFSSSCESSLDYIRQFVNRDISGVYTSDQIIEALEEFRITAEAGKKPDAKQKRLNKIDGLICSVQARPNPTIATLKDIEKAIDLKKIGKKASALKASLAQIWHSERVYDIQERYIRLLFKLAGRWQAQFTEFKKQRNVVDYNDMERYMLKLISMPDLADEIAKGYRYLFVDEFQDCSPIQVKIFTRMSELMEHSYWVGDYKQAIYGFRGSDIKLTKSVVDRVATGENGCDTYTLNVSYRSLPEIVNLCNDSFKSMFSDMITEDHVCLKPYRQGNEGIRSLRYWDVSGDSQIGLQVAALIRSGVKPSEIAILGRSNIDLDKMAQEITALGIPVNRENMDTTVSEVPILLPAILQIVQSKKDTLAKANVAFLTEKDYDVKRLIEEKISFNADESTDNSDFLNDSPIVAKVIAMREKLRQQSISAMVSTVIIELDLYNVVKQWDNPQQSAACLDAIVDCAASYETHCLQMGIASSISGFISYYNDAKSKCAVDPDGVQLVTFHMSKGLQWKYVIITSLYKNPGNRNKSVKNNIYGVHVVYSTDFTAQNPFPDVGIRIVPWIYGSSKSNVPSDIQTIIENSDDFKAVHKSALDESKRLLYVGMTRPKDVLIMAIEKPEKRLQWLWDLGVEQAGKAEPKDGEWDIIGNGHLFHDFTLSSDERNGIANDFKYKSQESELLCKRIPYASVPCGAPRRDLAPSFVAGKTEVKSFVDFGKRIPLANLGDRTMDEVGNCIHQIFCALDTHECSMSYVEGIIVGYEMTGILTSPDEIVAAWQRLAGWLTDKYGSPVHVYHERQFCHFRDGQIYRGSMDLVWQTAVGDVLIDFKTCPMGKSAVTDPESDHYAGLYAGQIDCYEQSLTAAGETVLSRYIYYPVNGALVEI